MDTPPEHSGWVCGMSGATAEERASPLYPPRAGHIDHALRRLTVQARARLQAARQIVEL
jgi:hypothetical protein